MLRQVKKNVSTNQNFFYSNKCAGTVTIAVMFWLQVLYISERHSSCYRRCDAAAITQATAIATVTAIATTTAIATATATAIATVTAVATVTAIVIETAISTVTAIVTVTAHCLHFFSVLLFKFVLDNFCVVTFGNRSTQIND